MKTFVLMACVASLALAGGAGLGGCSTTGSKQKDAAASSMADLQRELESAKVRVQETMAALGQVEVTASSDPRPAFAKFADSVDAVEKQAAGIRARADSMRARASNYYEAWQKELETVSNDELRGRAVERREESKKNFERINEAMQEARAAYEPLIADLRDVRTVLKNDLTAGGVRSVSQLTRETGQEAGRLLDELDGAILAVSKARTAMSTPRAGA